MDMDRSSDRSDRTAPGGVNPFQLRRRERLTCKRSIPRKTLAGASADSTDDPTWSWWSWRFGHFLQGLEAGRALAEQAEALVEIC